MDFKVFINGELSTVLHPTGPTQSWPRGQYAR